MEKQDILSEIKRTAEENGGTALGRRRFEAETGIKMHEWYGIYWSRWGDALVEAGYPPNAFQLAYTDDLVLQKLASLIRKLGHFPTHGEVRLERRENKDFPTKEVFSRFGGKQELIQAMLKYCETHDLEEGISAVCRAAMPKERSAKRRLSKGEEPVDGFVYLMKSSRRFKIGRSNCAERRESELGIILPEKLELIHKIRTDDPVGIEKYWHDRFKEKRMRGEWFDLSAADVKAFKRRKFM